MSVTLFETANLSDCLEEAITFRNANRKDSRDLSYYLWRYHARPCSMQAFVHWALEDGEPLGAATVAAHDYFLNGEHCILGVVGDISVSPQARGKGIGRKLLQSLRRQLPDTLRCALVMPNAAAIGPLLHAGWYDVDAIERRVKPLGSMRGESLVFELIRCSMSFALRAGELSQWTRTLKDWALGDPASGLADIDEIWDCTNNADLCLAVRDSAYLRWRYSDCPHTKFEIRVLRRGGDPYGYVVFHRVANDVWIDDFSMIDRSNYNLLIILLLRELRLENKTRQIHLRAASKTLSNRWKTCGFLSRPDSQ